MVDINGNYTKARQGETTRMVVVSLFPHQGFQAVSPGTLQVTLSKAQAYSLLTLSPRPGRGGLFLVPVLVTPGLCPMGETFQ